MKRNYLFLLIILFLHSSCESEKKKKIVYSKPFDSTWESLITNDIPEWLMDAKFGIYAHWGVYAVPAYGSEWYAKNMYDESTDIYKHHVENWGEPSKFGYKDFIPMFKAEKYNPAEWVEVIKQSGAKYAGLALVHHDGFCIWDTKFTRWNSVNMGPKRDLYGDFVTELRKNDMHVLATFHHIRTYNWYLPWLAHFWMENDSLKRSYYLGKNYDIFDPLYGDLYWNEEVGRKRTDFIREWRNKVTEVIDNYEPDMIWFDGGAFQDEESSRDVQELLSYYYNKQNEWQKPVVVLNKLPGNMIFNFPYDLGMLTFEEGRDRKADEPRPWIDDMKISYQGWGYLEGQTYKAAKEIIHGLIDRVSRGGGLLLNLSPKADGTIPEGQKTVLRDIGDWLAVNGEAIYETRPWSVQAEGPDEKFFTQGKHPKWNFAENCDAGDIRFTVKDNNLYVMALGWPDDMRLNVKSIKSGDDLSRRIKKVSLLGTSQKVEYSVDQNGMHIILPERVNNVAVALKLVLKK